MFACRKLLKYVSNEECENAISKGHYYCNGCIKKMGPSEKKLPDLKQCALLLMAILHSTVEDYYLAKKFCEQKIMEWENKPCDSIDHKRKFVRDCMKYRSNFETIMEIKRWAYEDEGFTSFKGICESLNHFCEAYKLDYQVNPERFRLIYGI